MADVPGGFQVLVPAHDLLQARVPELRPQVPSSASRVAGAALLAETCTGALERFDRVPAVGWRPVNETNVKLIT